MARRTFKCDPVTKRLVETTDERTKKLCEEIEVGTEKFKQPLEFGLPRSRERRNVSARWPYESDQMAVNPEDIARTQEILRQNGVHTDFNPKTGRPIMRDARHRKAHAEALGYFDRNGGYSDPAPKNFRESDVDEYRIQAITEAILALEGL